MKNTVRYFFYFFGAMLLVSGLSQRSHAKARDMDGSPETLDSASSVVDPGEEARKIKRLVKLALYPNATEVVKKSLSDEIAFVENRRKLKDDIVKHLLQDDDVDNDPTLPKVVRVTYKDGTIRGILFVQTDADKSAKPGELAWVLDSKKEKKELGQR